MTKDEMVALAFPQMGNSTHEGLSMRDWFAAHAMDLLMRTSQGMHFTEVEMRRRAYKHAADMAYEAADAMLKARAAPSQTGESPR